MLGHQVFLKLQKAFGVDNIACTLRKQKSHYDRFSIFKSGLVFDQVDVSDFAQVEKVLASFKPQAIVNCIGLTLRKKELDDFEKAIQINAMLPHRLALWGQSHKARVIHFSTDCVFDGKKGNYSESDLPTADDLYGHSKFLGEVHYPNALTLRLSIVGRELEGKTELVEWFLSQKGKSIHGFLKVLYSGLTTNQVAKEVINVLQNFPALSGVYQLASEPISKYELLKIVSRIYSCQTEILENRDYVSDKTLNCDLYTRATGFKRPNWKDMITEMKNEEQVSYDA